MMGRSILLVTRNKELSMIIFRVPDMTCGHCTGTIAKAVAAEDPAARVEFDLPAHLVRITSASATSTQLETAIRAAGYSPETVQDPAPAPTRAARGGCGCGCGPTSRAPVDVRQARVGAQRGCCA
jgi:copper chaperone